MEVGGVVFRSVPWSTADAAMKQQFNRLFSDKGHLQYYNGPRMAMKEKKQMKKQLKLLKKKLTNFSDMDFGLNPDHQVISEATEVLLGQLQKLRTDKLERKRKKKMMESESSCSSSSESECQIRDQVNWPNAIVFDVEEKRRQIEVCMGGKCKKSGGEVLLEKLGKAVGGEAAVVGCKCMGKCRDGPNVRLPGKANPLCIGVGLEDVDMIVTQLLSSPLIHANNNNIC